MKARSRKKRKRLAVEKYANIHKHIKGKGFYYWLNISKTNADFLRTHSGIFRAKILSAYNI